MASENKFSLGQIIIFFLIGGIIGHIVMYFLLKKKESSYDPFTALDPFGEEKPSCPKGQVWMDSLPGCVDQEASYRAFRKTPKPVQSSSTAVAFTSSLPFKR